MLSVQSNSSRRLKMAETPWDALKSEIREELYCQRGAGIEGT